MTQLVCMARAQQQGWEQERGKKQGKIAMLPRLQTWMLAWTPGSDATANGFQCVVHVASPMVVLRGYSIALPTGTTKVEHRPTPMIVIGSSQIHMLQPRSRSRTVRLVLSGSSHSTGGAFGLDKRPCTGPV